jgi:hypothetical protein
MSAASQKNVAWLLEAFSPFCFEVTQTGKTSKPPKITHAVDMLMSAEFREATSALVFPVRRGREHCDACPRRKQTTCSECERCWKQDIRGGRSRLVRERDNSL